MSDYIITYVSISFYYLLFLLAIKAGYKNGSGQLKDVLAGKGELGALMIRFVAGIFLLGICSAIVFVKRNMDSGIIVVSWNEYDMVVWVLMTIAIIIGSLSAFKKISPNNFNHSLPLSLPLFFLLIRALFLIVYELFFRGVVLFIMIEDFGLVEAIAANLLLYVLAHWFDKRERYGSIIMGPVLCCLSIYYNSVWPSIIIHLALCLSHEITLLINNKSLIKKSWS